eukprot:g4674.t1
MSFTDSQSGMDITVPAGAQLHLLVPGPAHVDAALACEPFSVVVDNNNPHLGLEALGVVAGHAIHVGPGAAAEPLFDPGTPPVLVEISAEADASVWDDCCSEVEEAKGAGAIVRASLLHAFADTSGFATDATDVQLGTARLADAGADVIMLMDTTDDEDQTREVLEACLWNDVVGLPMSARLGVRARAAGSKKGDVMPMSASLRVAMEMGIRHYDCDLCNIAAPALGPLTELLEEHGASHGLDTTAAEAFIDQHCH